MEEPEPKTEPRSETATPPPAEPCLPCPPPEFREGFPTRFARLFFGVITLLVLYFSYLIIKPYLLDIFMALVLFFTAKPLYRGLTGLLRGWKVLASALTCLILLLIILIPLFSLMSIIATQALDFSSQVTRDMQNGQLWHWIAAKIDDFKAYLVHLNLPLPPGEINLAQIVQTAVTRASAFIYTNAIGLIKGFTVFFFDLLLVLFITFFMFLQGDDFIEALKQLSPLEAAHNEEILRETETTIKATLWGTVIVAFVQGALGGVGFLIFGLPQPAFWGTVMIPAAVIPVVGSTIIWGPGAVYLLWTGHIASGIGLIIWGGVVVSVIDNVLKPILVRGSGETPSIFILFSILGGLTYFGMIGFILGPLILSFLLSLLRIYQKTILAPSTFTLAAPLPESKRPIPQSEDGP
ncbi:MAG: AI-2E family transporter [Syntrophobacterales bacterium]|jgi:predicted PurR-regulated permease PerM|nr:AI-2E family transporter [Syntrophobacterales bacterium]